MLLIIAVTLASCNQHNKSTSSSKYTCPMHPEIVKNEQGTCPICFMDLVPMHNNADMKVAKDVEELLENVNQVIVSDVKTIYPRKTALSDTIILNGKVSYDTRKQYAIASTVNGRIEKLYVKYNFQPIRIGQKIMDIYSQDLVSAQQDILFLQKNGDKELLSQAIQKLRLLGATQSQINTLLSNKQIMYSFPVYSRYNGYLSDFTPPAKDMDSESLPLQTVQGMYVNAGETVFRIYDNSSLWGEFSVAAEDMKTVKEQNKILLDNKAYPIISYIPYFKENGNFATIKINLSKENYQVGKLLTATIISSAKEGIWVPEKAIFNKGTSSVVFVKQGKNLRPKEVIPDGHKSKNMIGIKSGITENDRIAENASYLIDSEGTIVYQ